MNISVACDTLGMSLMNEIAPLLREALHEVVDHGHFVYRPDEGGKYFIDVLKEVASSILEGKTQRGIIFSGGGIIPVLVCNKIPGIRATIIHDPYTAHIAVEHDHVQIMCVGGQVVGKGNVWELINIFLNAVGDQNGHSQRVLEELGKLDGSIKQ